MTLEKNGELMSSGTTAEVWATPRRPSLACQHARRVSDPARADSIVMAGAVTAALPAQAGDSFTVSFQGMGSLTVKFV
jgi:2-keto-4-pentenoate hydratase